MLIGLSTAEDIAKVRGIETNHHSTLLYMNFQSYNTWLDHLFIQVEIQDQMLFFLEATLLSRSSET